MTLEELRTYLGVGEKYKDYRDLKKRVLEPAVEEVSYYTDLNVEWEPKKKGRKYEAVEFTIKKKGQWDGYEAYRRTIAELNGVHHDRGQINIFE